MSISENMPAHNSDKVQIHTGSTVMTSCGLASMSVKRLFLDAPTPWIDLRLGSRALWLVDHDRPASSHETTRALLSPRQTRQGVPQHATALIRHHVCGVSLDNLGVVIKACSFNLFDSPLNRASLGTTL